MVKKRRKVKIEITDMPEDPGVDENELVDDELEDVAGGAIVGTRSGTTGMQANVLSRPSKTALGGISGVRVGVRGSWGKS